MNLNLTTIAVALLFLSGVNGEALWHDGPVCRPSFGLLHTLKLTKTSLDQIVTNSVKLECCYRNQEGLTECQVYSMLTKDMMKKFADGKNVETDNMCVPLAFLVAILMISLAICLGIILKKHWKTGRAINVVV